MTKILAVALLLASPLYGDNKRVSEMPGATVAAKKAAAKAACEAIAPEPCKIFVDVPLKTPNESANPVCSTGNCQWEDERPAFEVPLADVIGLTDALAEKANADAVPAVPNCNPSTEKVVGNGTALSCATDATGTSSGSIPAGVIVFTLGSACPSGFSEPVVLAGRFLLTTTVAAGDVGGTGGSDTITEVLNHTHTATVTDPGHTHLTQRYPTATGSSSGFTIDTSMSGTPADNTLSTKSGTTGITVANANPVGGVASIENRPAFIKVIACQKD